MKRSVWILIVVALVVIVGGGIGLMNKRTETTTQSLEQPVTNSIKYQGLDGKNALELLKTNAKIETVTDPNLGEYVTNVNGIKSGENNKYWMYYVNGIAGAVGADAYITKSTDTIEWKFE